MNYKIEMVHHQGRAWWAVYAGDDGFKEPVSEHETRDEAERAVDRYRHFDERRATR